MPSRISDCHCVNISYIIHVLNNICETAPMPPRRAPAGSLPRVGRAASESLRTLAFRRPLTMLSLATYGLATDRKNKKQPSTPHPHKAGRSPCRPHDWHRWNGAKLGCGQAPHYSYYSCGKQGDFVTVGSHTFALSVFCIGEAAAMCHPARHNPPRRHHIRRQPFPVQASTCRRRLITSLGPP